MPASTLRKLTLFAAAVASLKPLPAAVLPYGAELEVRLLHKVGSRVSHLGDSVEAILISPVYDHDKLLIAPGAKVLGTVQHIERLGLGLRHTSARVDLEFTRLCLNDNAVIPIEAHVASVETAREAVRTDGAILGINPTANFSTGVSALFTLSNLAEREFRVPILFFKFLAARSPDAEISLPAGTELLLRLTRNAEIQLPADQSPAVSLLPATQIAAVQDTLSGLPAQQTDRGNNHPSDLVNVFIMGSREEVFHAFRAAGWTIPESHGVLALYHMFHCAVERKNYNKLPMSNLKLNGSIPNAAFEKGLNTFSKRHHIRLWQDAESGAWLGAATEDVSYKFAKAHLTHATDRHIDNERSKIVNDLAFTGCIDKGVLIPRDYLKPSREPGSSILTDGDIAVVQLNGCNNPRLMPADPQKPAPVRAVGVAIAVGEDIARSNPFSTGYALAASLLESGKIRANARLQAVRAYSRPAVIGNASANRADGSLAVR